MLKSRKEGKDDSNEFSAEDIEAVKQAGVGKFLLSLAYILVGGVALYFGSGWLVEHGEILAVDHLHVDPAVVALILIAFGTSVPELATSVVAARKGEGDIILGNAVGSCIFNLLAVMGVTALVKPVTYEGIQSLDLWVMIGVTVAILPFMLTKMKLSRIEGAVMLMAYLGYCGVIFAMQKGLI